MTEWTTYSRRTVMKACAIIAHVGHSDLTQFFNELGLEDFDAGSGSRHTRAMALATYAGKNPQARTADGYWLNNEIVKMAAWIDRRYPDSHLADVRPGDRADFWDSLKADGFKAENGKIVLETSVPSDVELGTPADGSPEAKLMGLVFGEKEQEVKLMNNRVFVVHGRQRAALAEVALYLRKLRLEPVVLHEQPNGGRTLITKFSEVAAGASFAVVIMTPDDVGGLAGEPDQKGRARQNVIFELGFLVGKLGPANVCALVADGVEKPSDFDGVAYVRFGENTNWERELARELRAAAIPFDPNDAL